VLSNSISIKSNTNVDKINIFDIGDNKVGVTSEGVGVGTGLNILEGNFNQKDIINSVSKAKVDLLDKLEVGTRSKHLNIIYFNARSLRNKIDKLRILVSQLVPDVIAIMEP